MPEIESRSSPTLGRSRRRARRCLRFALSYTMHSASVYDALRSPLVTKVDRPSELIDRISKIFYSSFSNKETVSNTHAKINLKKREYFSMYFD